MADFTSFLDKDPQGTFKRVTAKPAKVKDPVEGHRKTLLRNIDKAKAAHADGKKRGGLFKHLADNFTRFEINIGRGKDKKTVPLKGNSFNMLPTEHFPAFLDSFKSHVEGKQFDPELRLASEGTVSAGTARKTRKPRGPMSPEALAARNAKRAATLAAKNK